MPIPVGRLSGDARRMMAPERGKVVESGPSPFESVGGIAAASPLARAEDGERPSSVPALSVIVCEGSRLIDQLNLNALSGEGNKFKIGAVTPAIDGARAHMACPNRFNTI